MSDSEQKPSPDTDPGAWEEAATTVRPVVALDETSTLPSTAVQESGPPLPAPGQLVAGRYTVLEVLGRGAMGLVLAAYDARLDRRVALKLVGLSANSRSDIQPEARMVREAQAMARLSHPHVVQVYDAGNLEDGALFIAMEHVQGQTLRCWCEQQPRPWREVLQAYLAAGRGLAAAHAAGIIHRDFKPDNVLVGTDGRVRVTDFGLARAESSAPSLSTPTPVALPPQAGSWESALTLPGTVLGTPRYMAPELLLGQPADTRSDVFAFCVSLYEALHGQLPYLGQSLTELTRAQLEGRVNPPPASSQVPGWVHRALLRGLQGDAQQRPGSMQALLAALEEDPEVKHRARLRAGALALGAAALAGLAVWGWVGQRGQGCGGMEERLAGVWDGAVAGHMREALLGTGLPYAPATAERVSAVLDGYASRWVALSTEACEAGRRWAAQPRSLAVLQEYCLERRRSQLRALTELLTHSPDRELLGKAVQAAQALPPLEDCAEAKVLTAAVPPPEDPSVRERVNALQEQVDRLEALLEAGKYKQGLHLGKELLQQVEQVKHAPLHARALFQVARLMDLVGDYVSAEQHLRQAIAVAARGKDLALVAQASSNLLFIVGNRQSRHQEAMTLRPLVEAAVEVVDDSRTHANFLLRLGTVLRPMGRLEEARQCHERALALQEKVLGPEHPDVALALNGLATTLREMGRHEEARHHHERALALREKVLGPEHPDVALSLNNLGNLLTDMGRGAEAVSRYERALALWERVLGPEHPTLAYPLNSLGSILSDQGRYDEARQRLERALALQRKALGPEHPNVADSLDSLGGLLLNQARYEEARQRFEQVVALQERALGPEHPELGYTLGNLSRALTGLGRYAEARQRLERALSMVEKTLGREHPSVAAPLLVLGQLELAQGRAAQAVPLLERALALALPRERAEVQLSLAQALWSTPQARPRALELATQARDYWQRVGHEPYLAQASRWLAAHPPP